MGRGCWVDCSLRIIIELIFSFLSVIGFEIESDEDVDRWTITSKALFSKKKLEEDRGDRKMPTCVTVIT